ncbi:MAG: exodeoxyribonuclease VII large subunit [Acidobacteria bacterium]|nr:exodeoxyribonuclease VII large subunit [Acidobacteriota bacterium]
MTSLFDLPLEEPEPEPSAPPPPPVRRVWTVAELTASVRDTLETRFTDVWVEGELSNARVWTTGHLYFTLKDANAQIKGVMFKSALRYLRFTPQDGLRVVVRGRLSVYDPKGEYQIVAEHMEPRGHGALQLAFEQVKKTLAAEGLFDPARKRPLPSLPRRIGVVTSLDGAALRDIIRVLRRRYPNVHLVIAPSKVQGEDAAGEIVRALRFLGRIHGVDVIIVGRGGGSLEDLWAFNEAKVARAIAASPVPVISAVGHETDFTIADFVADLRAPTPSAAAELVVRRKDEFCGHIDRLSERLGATALARVRRLATRVHVLEARPGFAGLRGRVAMRGRHVAELNVMLGRAWSSSVAKRGRRHDLLRRALDQFDPRHRLGSLRARLVTEDARLARAVARRRHAADSRFRAMAARLDGLSPLAVLARGYAVCWDADRTRIVRDAATVETGHQVHVTLERGELTCRVERQNEQAAEKP